MSFLRFMSWNLKYTNMMISKSVLWTNYVRWFTSPANSSISPHIFKYFHWLRPIKHGITFTIGQMIDLQILTVTVSYLWSTPSQSCHSFSTDHLTFFIPVSSLLIGRPCCLCGPKICDSLHTCMRSIEHRTQSPFLPVILLPVPHDSDYFAIWIDSF